MEPPSAPPSLDYVLKSTSAEDEEGMELVHTTNDLLAHDGINERPRYSEYSTGNPSDENDDHRDGVASKRDGSVSDYTFGSAAQHNDMQDDTTFYTMDSAAQGSSVLGGNSAAGPRYSDDLLSPPPPPPPPPLQTSQQPPILSSTSSVSLNHQMRKINAEMKMQGESARMNNQANDSNDDNHLNNQPSDSSAGPAYYLTRPKTSSFLFLKPLSLSQKLREYRHNHCIMTPLSLLVVLAILITGIVTLLLSFPQFLLGLFLGPLVKRNAWMVEFLYRSSVAKWGHLKIMSMAEKSKVKPSGGGEKSNSSNSSVSSKDGGMAKKILDGHSVTLHQRITVVKDRVYVHPIPQFTDNIAYLIVCTPPKTADDDGICTNEADALPILAVLVDCGEAAKVFHHMELIYATYYKKDYPTKHYRRQSSTHNFHDGTYRGSLGMELYAVLCTHCHHDHTAGLKDLRKELTRLRLEDARYESYLVDTTHSTNNDTNNNAESNIYREALGNLVIVGGAVENVPYCNLFVKNGCFVPLPSVSLCDEYEINAGNILRGASTTADQRMINDMNALISIEAIGVPSHTRGSVVFALRNRTAPGVVVQLSSTGASSSSSNRQTSLLPLQSHLFTGDAIFTGGGGVPFEADLEYSSDNFVKNPKSLKLKNGSSKFRPGAGTLSMERCFAEVLTRAQGPFTLSSVGAGADGTSSNSVPQDAGAELTSQSSSSSSEFPPETTLLYPGHEYTTDLLLRQFDQKTMPPDGHWTRTSPAVFFETASHYLVSAHRRALPQGQKVLTVPTPLARECIVNPNFRSLKRRGEHVANALRFWYEFGASNLIPDNSGEHEGAPQNNNTQLSSVFTTVFSADLDEIANELRNGTVSADAAAHRIESLKSKLDERPIGRRPIPNTLPSHKNVYLGVVALAALGSAPSAVTVSDASIMGMAPPVENTDRILVSKRRLISVLGGLGILSNDESPLLQDIIHLLWKEARLDDELRVGIEQKSNVTDIESSIQTTLESNDEDQIELGLLKLALFGVAFNQPSKFCMPCLGSSKPRYDEQSWVIKSNLRRTNGELVRHDAERCLLCRESWRPCPHIKGKSAAAFR